MPDPSKSAEDKVRLEHRPMSEQKLQTSAAVATSRLDMESEALRSSSAPAQSTALAAKDSHRSPEAEDDTKREKPAEAEVSTEDDTERHRALSAPALVSETMEHQAPGSKKRPASASPRAASASVVPETASLPKAVASQAVEDTAVISRDFAAPSDQTKSVPIAPRSEREVHEEEGTTPSKRRKSEIAPWMTERHKTAIRRSLGGAPAASSDTPVQSSPSKPSVAASEESVQAGPSRR